jgi:serine protease Do
MTESSNTPPQHRNALSARRLKLLASVAALGLAVLAVGLSGYRPVSFPAWTPSAHAAADVALSASGFADIVAKVKPAVISVRVKIDESAKTTGMNQNGDDNVTPFEPGSSMEKFFRQFGFRGMPNGMPHGEQTITGEGSGFSSPRMAMP